MGGCGLTFKLLGAGDLIIPKTSFPFKWCPWTLIEKSPRILNQDHQNRSRKQEV
jgi:hypothetical protein